MPTLQWLSRDDDLKAASLVPYRLLEPMPEFDGGDPEAAGSQSNMLIQGDNLDALKSLVPFYAGKVKCIYIDPPYNTGSAFEHYDDNLEHSQWLAMMWPRLELLRELLSDDGSIWISLDDAQAHYLKVVMDELFGRKNFIANVIWEKKYARQNDSLGLSNNHDHKLVFAKSLASFSPNQLERSEKQLKSYKNPDDDARGRWQSVVYTCSKSESERPNLFYPIKHPKTGVEVWPKRNRVWAYDRQTTDKNIAENRLWWGNKMQLEKPRKKSFLCDVKAGIVPNTIWGRLEVGDNQDARREVRSVLTKSDFDTPKPERLIQRILHIATNPGDLVLDSFLGSGTTAAVAHKMGRRWIGIEMGDHARTHCVPRLHKVIEGEQGGISDAVGWQGGGNFRFYTLGEPVFGEDGRIRDAVPFDVLAAHVWFSETRTPLAASANRSPFLGSHANRDDERGVALLYNGILRDRSINGGNVLNHTTLAAVRKAGDGFSGPLTIYGERSALSEATLLREDIIFRQTPYDVAAVRA